MGRRRLDKVKKTIKVDRALCQEVELLLFDPQKLEDHPHGTAKYGAWSLLIETLLRQWVEERRRKLTLSEL